MFFVLDHVEWMARLSSVKLMASESKELLIQPQQLQSRVSRDWEQKTRQKTILRGSVKRCNESQRRGTRSFGRAPLLRFSPVSNHLPFLRLQSPRRGEELSVNFEGPQSQSQRRRAVRKI